ncbi:MAG: response regulator [Pseudomonadota bacterium]
MSQAAIELKILFVEDEADVRTVVTQMLEVLGCHVVVAEDCEHALALLREQEIDLLISDVIMPDQRGPDLYQTAKEIKPDLPALFVSGYTEDMLQEVPQNSSVGFLRKPFSLKQLRAALEKLS